MAEDEILKCNNLEEASIFFDQGLRKFTHKNLLNAYFQKIDIKMEEINEERAKKLPRIKENIKLINEYENRKKKQLFNVLYRIYNCNLARIGMAKLQKCNIKFG